MAEDSPQSRPYVVRTDGEGVVTLTLDRGERCNPLSSGMIAALRREIAAIADDINKGNISEAESKKQVNTVFTDVDSQFRDCQFGIDH